MWLFLIVQWIGLECEIVVFPDHTHLLFYIIFKTTHSTKRIILTSLKLNEICYSTVEMQHSTVL